MTEIPKEVHLENMYELERRIDKTHIITCPVCGYWCTKYIASWDVNLKFICPECQERAKEGK